MTHTIVVRPRAEDDIDDYWLYLTVECDAPSAADRFLQCLEAAFNRLSNFPSVGVVQDYSEPRLAGLRRWPVPGFDDRLIYYLVHETSVDVVRILGGPQDRPTILRDM